MGWVIFLLVLAVVCVVVALYPRPKDKPSLTPEEKPDTYQDQAQPGQGVLKNVGTRFKVRSDTETQAVVNAATATATEGIRLGGEAVSADLEKKAVPERHHEIREKEKTEHQTYLIQHRTQQKAHQLQERLIDAAMALDIDVETYLKGRLNEMDVRKLEAEAAVKIRAGLLYQRRAFEQLGEYRTRLDELYEREHEIESNEKLPDKVKEKQLGEVRKDIVMLEEKVNGERKRLVQAPEQNDDSGSDEDTDY